MKTKEMKALTANELRIGNWIKDVSDPNHSFNIKIVIDDLYAVENFEPIPLTEQWLKDFNINKGFAVHNDFCSGFFTIKFSKILNRHRLFIGDIGLRDLDYVHTLQNVVYFLTGKELMK